MKEVYEFLKNSETYFIATIDGDRPRVRPFGTVNLFEDKLYIQTGKKKDVSAQIGKNPHIEICAMFQGKWIRIEATAIEDNRIEAKQSMLDAYPSLQSMYKADDDNTQVFWLKKATATLCSFTETPRVIKF